MCQVSQLYLAVSPTVYLLYGDAEMSNSAPMLGMVTSHSNAFVLKASRSMMRTLSAQCGFPDSAGRESAGAGEDENVEFMPFSEAASAKIPPHRVEGQHPCQKQEPHRLMQAADMYGTFFQFV